MNKSTKIEWKPIDELIPYEHNAKKHTKTQIANLKTSFEKFGWQNPVLIDENNVIICGHGRILGAREAGMDEAPCIVCKDLTEKEIKDYRHLDNLLSEGDYLQDEFDIDLPDLSDFDFSEININIDLDGLTIDEPTEVIEDEIPEEAESRCKLGDLWQLGNHRLICGDSTDPDVVERLMQGSKADLCLTDPPYGINIVNHRTGKIGGDKEITSGKTVGGGLEKEVFGQVVGKLGGDHKAEARVYKKVIGDETTETAQKSYEILKQFTNNQIIFGGNYFTDFLPPKACWVVWDKDNGDSFLADGEMAWTSFDKGMKIYRWLWNGMSRQGDRETELKERVHPTQKPVGMLAEILKDFTNENETVLDLFGGSGSTLIACEQLNRNCYICELDEHYCDVIIQRWENFTGEKAKKIN